MEIICISTISHNAPTYIKYNEIMTQEEKQLLLQDICGRLPYGVITKNCRNNFDVPAHLLPDVIGIKLLIDEYDLKPYLRPMSSMTKKERQIFDEVSGRAFGIDIIENSMFHREGAYGCYPVCIGDITGSIDYLNSIHVDYRGLIPMGLAIEAPKDMYQ